LVWAAYIAGMRESRRLLGDLILNEQDVTEPNWYEDGIIPTGWKIDVHYPNPRYLEGFEGDAFISTVTFQKCVSPYYIPYRCLYSRNIPNLFMAGRDISVTRKALGTVRVMRTTALMGEVVGMAATLCTEHGVDPRGVYEKHLGDLKEMCGMERDVFAKTESGTPGEIKVMKPEHGLLRMANQELRYMFYELPKKLKPMRRVVVYRGDSKERTGGFSFKISAPAEIHIAVHSRGGFVPPDGWKKTGLKTEWSNGDDTIYVKHFEAGTVNVPGHDGKQGDYFGFPHAAFVPMDVTVSK